MEADASAGYDTIADQFIAMRSASGRKTVQGWARSLPTGCSIVDVGAGYGEPLTSVLIKEGLSVWAIDASPKLIAEFSRRFPNVEVACEAAQHSSFFSRTFDAAMIVGVIFLLKEDVQHAVIQRLGNVLRPDGRLLLSAPWQTGTWKDVLTNETSRSLGAATYQRLLENSGFGLITTYSDEDGNHYYDATRL